MGGSHMTSYDAEQSRERLRRKEGKMDTSQEREAEKLGQRCGRGGSTNTKMTHQGIDLVGCATVLLIDNLCLIQSIILYVIL